MAKRGKKYIAAAAKIDTKKFYAFNEGVELVKTLSTVKFDASIDLVIKLNLDTTKVEQQFRGNLTLPYFFGKVANVLVIDDTLTKETAKELGIKHFGGANMIADIKDGWMDFSVIITTPKFMPELSKLGKILGPKGLMPNPKLGTVTMNTAKTAAEFLKGKTAYRTDSYGNVHIQVGKVSSATDQLAENVKYIMQFFLSKRPNTVKGEYVQKVCLSSSMGPSVKLVKEI